MSSFENGWQVSNFCVETQRHGSDCSFVFLSETEKTGGKLASLGSWSLFDLSFFLLGADRSTDPTKSLKTQGFVAFFEELLGSNSQALTSREIGNLIGFVCSRQVQVVMSCDLCLFLSSGFHHLGTWWGFSERSVSSSFSFVMCIVQTMRVMYWLWIGCFLVSMAETSGCHQCNNVQTLH